MAQPDSGQVLSVTGLAQRVAGAGVSRRPDRGGHPHGFFRHVLALSLLPQAMCVSLSLRQRSPGCLRGALGFERQDPEAARSGEGCASVTSVTFSAALGSAEMQGSGWGELQSCDTKEHVGWVGLAPPSSEKNPPTVRIRGSEVRP